MTRLCFASALVLLAFGSASTSAKNGDIVISFSADPEKVVGNVVDLDIRPNTSQPYYLYLTNKSDDTRDVTVQVTDLAGKVLSEAKLKMVQTQESKQNPKPMRIMLAKAAPPMPAPGAAPAPMPMGPPVPPGTAIKPAFDAGRFKNTFGFKVRVFDDRDKDKPSEEREVVISVRQPTTYIKPASVLYRKKGSTNQFSIELKPEGSLGVAACPVELAFPPQATVKSSALREGVYRREIAEGKSAKLYAKDLPLRGQGSDGAGVVNVSVDGVPRAYVYRPNLHTDTAGRDATVNEQAEPAIRFMEATGIEPPDTLFTRPQVVPVRVETDVAPPGSAIHLKIKRLPENEEVETIVRNSTREERVWLDAAGEDAGLLVSAKVNDWVIPLNARDFRGKYLLQAQLINPADKDKPLIKSFDRTLVVDDTKPEELRIDLLPNRVKSDDPPKHIRTLPLPVHVFAHDPESKIVKVVVFFGKPAPDGKLPEGAVEATAPKLEGGAWVAQLPLAADRKGLQEVTAQAINAVGIADSSTQKIQLLDPPTGGTIKGVVALGQFGKGQAGLTVVLKDGEGKEKGSAKTNDKGEFTMEDVLPGTYKVAASRPDSGVGTKGEESVTVKAGKTTEVKIILTRKP